MHIHELRLHARDLDAQRIFFGETLGLSIVDSTPEQLTVQVGQTTLIFEHQPGWAGIYHYALNIPENQFSQAAAWLTERAALLSDSDGKQQFFFSNWDADAVYFLDADGNIAELIARHSLPTVSDDLFGVKNILCVSEIGWVSDDVLAAAGHLAESYGLSAYLGSSGKTFTAVGDENGLFILVPRHHPWMPNNQPAAPGWFSATIQTAVGRQIFAPE